MSSPRRLVPGRALPMLGTMVSAPGMEWQPGRDSGDAQLGSSRFREIGSKSSVLTAQKMLLWDLSSVLRGWWRVPCWSWYCL